MRGHKSLKGLFTHSTNPLPIDFQHKGYTCEEIETSSGTFFAPDPNLLNATLAVSEANARFRMSYNKKTQICDVKLLYRGDLPVWIKAGNPECWLSPEKGVPTAKMITKLLMDKLGLTKENVKTITSGSVNPQTVVDAAHALLVQGKSLPQAFALAHTSQLNAELGQTLEASAVHLISVQQSYRGSYCELGYLLENSELTDAQREAFKKQLKVHEIYALTGIDLFQDNTGLQPQKQVRVPDYINLMYRVTP